MKVDREAGIIRHVKVLGRFSRNLHPKTGKPYEYSRKAMEEAAAQYESVKVNVDHPPRDNPLQRRGFREWFGKLRNTVVEDDGVYADLHYLKSHADADVICEAAERMPDFGLSHVADVFEGPIQQNGKTVIEGVGKVRSVDVVPKPATNSTLWESEENVTTVKAILERHPKLKGLAVVFEEDAAMMDAPVETEGMEVNSDEEIKEAFKSMILAAFDDEGLDCDATIKRVREIIRAYYKLMKVEEPPEETDEPEGEEDVAEEPETPVIEEESHECKCARLENEIAMRDLLEEHDVKAEPARIKALTVLESDEERLALIADFPKRGKTAVGPGNKRPRSSSAIMEDEDEKQEITGDGKSLASAVRQQRFADIRE